MEMIFAIVVIIFSAILHEVMHGYVAERLGDPTARVMGRLTLNPIPHIDPIGSILFPLLGLLGGGIFFAWAKPVPVNPLYLREGKKDLALVALAGPLTNLSLAVIGSLLFKIPGLPFLYYEFFYAVVLYNLMLAIVNLFPIPPLDGSKVVTILMPDHIARQYLSIERFGFIILIMLFLFPIGPFSLGSVLQNLVFKGLHLLGM